MVVDYLVVAGGGSTSGGYMYRPPGGGGAGAMKEGSANLTGSVAITVGPGGAAINNPNDGGRAGGDSSIAGVVTCKGGGYGGCGQLVGGVGAGGPGGSGGGAGDWAGNPAGGGATNDNGFRGGNNCTAWAEGGYGGGGGGGAAAQGMDAPAGGQSWSWGGAGKASSISGAAVTYAQGGYSVEPLNPHGAVHGTPNTGNGGVGGIDGAGGAGGAGGSGIVILRYPGEPQATGGTITQAGGYTRHTFTSSGTFTVSIPPTAVTAVFIGSTKQMNAPAITVGAVTLTGGTIVSSLVLGMPGISPGPVTSGGSHVSSTLQVIAPTVLLTLRPMAMLI